MPREDLKTTIQLARGLVDHVPHEINEQLKELLLRAQDGNDPTIGLQITDLLTKSENIRRWRNEQISLQSGSRERYDGLAGNSRTVLSSQKWFCPKRDCDQWMLVIQEGEDAPVCVKHNVDMIRR